MRNLLGKASPAHTDTLGAHGEPSARGQTANHAKVQTGKRPWDFPAPPSHKPLNSSCLWMLLVAGTEMGPHKRALNTPSPAPPLTLTCIFPHISTAEPKCWWGCMAKSPQEHVDESSASPAGKAGKALSLPFFPACSRTRWTGCKGQHPRTTPFPQDLSDTLDPPLRVTSPSSGCPNPATPMAA